MSLVTLLLSVGDSAVTTTDLFEINAALTQFSLPNIGKYIDDISGGEVSAYVSVYSGPIQAYGLVTFTGAPSNGETLSILNTTFTAETSGATGNQFNIGGTVTASAVNLAAAINASTDLTGKVTATSALGVVTITSVIPGLVGNGLQLSESLSNATATAFAHGTDGNKVSRNFGAAS